MSDPKEEFMAEALRPIGSNHEARLSVWRWLSEMIGAADESVLQGAIRRWQEVDEGRDGRKVRKIALGLLTFVAVFGMALFPNPVSYVKQFSVATGSGGGGDNALKRTIGLGLNAEDRLLLGDQSLSPIQQKEALIASDPGNPAFFAESAVTYYSSYRRLPADFLETAHQLDPDNAWFDYFAAGAVASKSVENVKRTKEEREADVPLQWREKQPEKVREALELLRGAKGKTRFENYEEKLLKQRIPLLPQQNQIAWVASFAYLAGQNSAQMQMRDLVNVISSQAWKAGEQRDLELFRQTEEDASDLLGYLGKLEDISLIGEMVHLVAVSGVSTSLADAAAKLDLKEEVTRWEPISANFKQYNKDRRSRDRMEGASRMFMEKGGMIIALSGPMIASQLENPAPVTDADLKPARMMDHRLIGAASAIGVWILLGLVCFGLLMHQLKGAKTLRSLAMRGCQLLEVKDWLWVLLVGVILPVATVVLISWFTSAGGSDLSIKMTIRQPIVCLPAAHYLALLMILLILPAVIARWRLSMRAKAFGFSGISWMGVAVVLGLLFYVVGYLDVHWVVMNVALFSGAVWLLIMGGSALFGRLPGLLRRLLIGRVILPAYLLGMVCMVVVSAVSMASYKAWFRVDDFMRLTPDAPAMMPYEYKVAAQLRGEIKGMIQQD